MRRLLLFAGGIFFSLLSFAQTTIDDAFIMSQTWTKAGSPYNIMQNTTLMENQALTIEPGVRVVFHGYFTLTVQSADVFAVGTPADSIVFTVNDTTNFVNGTQEQGGWDQIRIYGSSNSFDTTVFSHCRFEYSKAWDNSTGRLGILGISNNSRVVIEKCLFTNNRAKCSGVESYGSNIHIRNNLFLNNKAGVSNVQSAAAAPLIYDNRFEGNEMEQIIYNPSYNPVIERNVITGNTLSSRIIYSRYNATIRNNVIIENYLGSNPVMFLEDDPLVENNLIANNQGMGIRVWTGDPTLLNNTIVNNTSYPLYLYQMDGGFISGNIIYGNDLNSYYLEGLNDPEIRYNLIEGGTAGFAGETWSGPQYNNLDQDPLFIDPTMATGPGQGTESADFGIQSVSPCINKGDPYLQTVERSETDLGGDQRIRYGIVDIGAYEGSIGQVTMPATIASNLTLVADSIFVSSDVTINDNVVLTISAGSTVIFEGKYRINNNGTILAYGKETEPIRFTAGDLADFWGSDESLGGWNGIWMDNSDGSMSDNQQSEFLFCIFEYAKWDGYEEGSALHLENIPYINMDNCIFRYNRSFNQAAAIYAVNSGLYINNCLVDSNVANQKYNCDGPFYFRDCDVNIYNTVFRDNIAGHGTGLYDTGSTLRLENCEFYNNQQVPYDYRAGATTLNLTNTECRFFNCIIANNKSNGAIIDLQNCTGFLNNCNIVNNSSTTSYSYAGIYFDQGHVDISNMIFWGNRAGSNIGTLNLANDTSDPDFYNCLIEGGLAQVKFAEGYLFSGDFIDCIDEDPAFLMPTAMTGPDPDYASADWSLYDVSPAINAGSEETGGFPDKDFAGNQRIIGERIDIGALEKEARSIEITLEPMGGIFCMGDSTILSVDYSNTDSVLFQWVKDGIDIPGEQSNTLNLDGLKIKDEGNYICRLTNALGKLNTLPVFIKVYVPPFVLLDPKSNVVQPNRPTSLKTEVVGTSVSYQWMKDGVPILDAVAPEIRFTPTDSSFEGNYYCMLSNSCGSKSTDTAEIYLAPQICMVTVDPATGHNLVIWEKKTKAPIMAYNIYRESVAAGIYDLLETVPFDELSEYTDTVADPTVQAYLYKMTAVGDDGYETDIDLCRPHKTIHLLVSTNPELNTTQLAWDKYYGFVYQTSIIYRSNDGAVFDSIHSISASLNSWTDPNPIDGDLFYRISVKKPDPCDPEGGSKKAGTGPYTHSLSNLDDNKLKTGASAPDSIMLSNDSVDENMQAGVLVGRLSSRDADTSDYHNYLLVEGTGDDDNAFFSVAGDLLITAASFDFETKNLYTVRVRSTDSYSYSVEQTLLIKINDRDESQGEPGDTPPDTLKLSNLEISENNLIGDLIGRLTTEDADTGDIHTYQLVSGTGDDDNDAFLILGDVLLAAGKYDFEVKSEYTVRIRSVDRTGNSVDNIFVINIIDVDETVGVGLGDITGLSVFPNPFSRNATILFPNPEMEAYTLRIVDHRGRTVLFRNNIRSSRIIINSSELGKGHYILLLSGKQQFKHRIVVK